MSQDITPFADHGGLSLALVSLAYVYDLHFATIQFLVVLK